MSKSAAARLFRIIRKTVAKVLKHWFLLVIVELSRQSARSSIRSFQSSIEYLKTITESSKSSATRPSAFGALQ
jgi:hypothetical protein